MSTLSQQATGEPKLQPLVETRCTVCGAAEHRTIAAASDLAAQRRYLVEFHRRRLRTRSDRALEDRADFTQNYVTNVVACRACGLVFRDPRPPAEEIARAYASDTYGEQRLRALFDSQLELFRPKARNLRRWLSRPDPVLVEIGSFVGGFLAASRELGWDAHGIDPGSEVAAFCEARGLSVLRESVEDLSFPEGAADCVAIWNTFDQLVDPHPTLRSARRCLRAGGLLVVRVPNGRCFESCMSLLARVGPALRSVLLAAMAWNNLVTFPYLHGYSVDTLDRLMAGYGFVRVHAEGDVLTRLADDETKTWAAWEERILKALWTLANRLDPSSIAERAPWLDVYYRIAK